MVDVMQRETQHFVGGNLSKQKIHIFERLSHTQLNEIVCEELFILII